ncbi:MAG: branched-chain amino acid ABC transporter permease, partial [Chloroflexota bacterium]
PFILRNLREDYQAAVMFILAIIASQIISTATNVFNGANGISDIPRPLHGAAGLNGMTYNWAYVVWVWVICGITYLVVERLARSGWGRALRAVRDQHVAAASIGLNPTALRIQVFVFGGVIAGLAGGLLVEFIGAWSPSGWGYAETFIFFAAIIVGGLENNRGAVLGTLLIPIIFTELPAFLPAVGYPGLVDSLEWVVIGAIWIGFLGFRPRGLVPARRNTLARLGRLRTLKPGPLPHPPA